MPVKAPAARLDYSINWRTKGWLATGENITASTWAINDATGVLETPTHTNDVAMIWFKDGLSGRSYTLINTIETSQGRIDTRSLIVPVDER